MDLSYIIITLVVLALVAAAAARFSATLTESLLKRVLVTAVSITLVLGASYLAGNEGLLWSAAIGAGVLLWHLGKTLLKFSLVAGSMALWLAVGAVFVVRLPGVELSEYLSDSQLEILESGCQEAESLCRMLKLESIHVE